MKKFFKQLFCQHIWKEKKRVFLRKEKSRDWGSISYTTYSYYHIESTCVKCGKKSNDEIKVILL